MQERFPVLNLARISVPKRGIEKFLPESAMMRGIAIPSVTLLMWAEPSVGIKFVVVQPDEPFVPQLAPVNPLVQMHEHVPLITTPLPPFRHGRDFAQDCRLTVVDLLPLLPKFLNTKYSKGITIAVAMIQSIRKMIRMKAHTGKPQHLRALGLALELAGTSWSSGVIMNFSRPV